MQTLEQLTIQFVKNNPNPSNHNEFLKAVNEIIQANADYVKANNYAELARIQYETNKDLENTKTMLDSAIDNYKKSEHDLNVACDNFYNIASTVPGIDLKETYTNNKELANDITSYYSTKNPLVELYADINRNNPDIFINDDKLQDSLLELSSTRPDVVTNKEFPDNLKEPCVLALAYASAIKKYEMYRNTDTIEFLRQNVDKIDLEVAIEKEPSVILDLNDNKSLSNIKETNPQLFNRLCYIAYEGYNKFDEHNAEKFLELIPDEQLDEFAELQYKEDSHQISYEFDEQGNLINKDEENFGLE